MVKYILCIAAFISLKVSAANDPKDTDNVQNILDAYYDCISGPIGKVRDFDRFRNLFHKDARLIYSYWNEETTEANLMIFNNVEEFIEKLDYLDKKGFYEYELANQTASVGAVTQVFSTYEFRVEDNSVSPQKGVTSYELFFDGDRYWIMSMFWTMESTKYPIPESYLKK